VKHYKAVLLIQQQQESSESWSSLFSIMVERIRLLDEGVDISDVMEDVNRVLDESITREASSSQIHEEP